MSQAAPPERPTPPRRARSMVVPVLIAVITMVLAGALGARTARGAGWGLGSWAGLLLALRAARIPVGRVDAAILAAGLLASTVLAAGVMPDSPPRIDVLLGVRFALAWLPAAVAAAWFAMRRHTARSSAVNAGIAWLAGAALALPVGSSLGVIRPLDGLGRGEEVVFGGGDYAIVGLAIGLFGAAALLGVITRLPALGTVSALVFLTVYAAAEVGFTIPGLLRNLGNVVNVPNFWPPDFGWAIGDGRWWWVPSWEFGSPNRANPLVETVRIAIVATVAGVGVSLPLAFLASTLTAPNRTAYLIDKGFINLIRTVPDLFWAMIFATAVGVGAFAGTLALFFFSLAIMSKLLSETVDTADPGPFEAAKATGGRHFPAVRASILPQVMPNYVAYSLYVFEINIRASVVLGIVGAGGIGRVLETQRSFFRFDRVLAVVILIFVIVFVIEQVSIAMRRRLV